MCKYKKLKADLEELATNLSETHKKAVEVWGYGQISKVWFDHDGNVCIEYQSGDWFHYNGEEYW